VIVTDLIAQSFIKIFNNAFLNTIERVRQPHLINVLKNLKTFAARVPPKYRGSIEKALRTEGFLSFLLSRAAVSLLCAKATLRPSETQLGREHEELATVVEELYIAALLHAEDQWDLELKADGKTFMAVATSFVKHLADPAPLKTANIQAALLGLDANPLIWTRYGLDLLGISLNSISIGGSDMGTSTEPKDRRKVSLLGGDSLYATAQWAMAKLDSRACRKLIAATIASYSDGQLRKRELLWNLDLTVKQYLEIEKVAGVAAFFGASTACAAFVNRVNDGIAAQLADFGSDLGLVVSLLKDVRTVGMQTALKLGRISAPIIFAMQRDQRLRELLSTRLTNPQDFEEALRRVKEYGMMPTIHLVNKLGARAAARLECLEESEEKEALLTLVRGVACLHLMEDGNVSSDDAMVEAELTADPESRVFDMKVANLRLRAQLQRVHSSEQRSKNRLDSIEAIARGDDVDTSSKRRTPKGLGLEFDSEEVEWLILRGLERRTPLPPQLDLNHLLSCVTKGRDEVQNRLIGLREVAQSTKLKNAIMEVFSSGGKRLRPALCLLVHSMLKTEGSADSAAAYEKVIVLATSIEIIHTASLVHDDILDDADQRRQQQTMHRIFGPDVAVLSGDFLFAHASGLIESLEDDEVTRLVSLVIEEFGYGELSQSAKRFDTSVSLFNYLKKSFYKTASLLAAACRASAVLTGLRAEVCDVLYTYGFYLGLAFQIADDVLDFTGGEELGKPIGQDLAEGNLTAPVILCLQGHEELDMEPSTDSAELARLISRRFAHRGDLERSLQIINDSGGVDRAYTLAEKMANKALEALTLVAPNESEARCALAGLCKWAVRRSS